MTNFSSQILIKNMAKLQRNFNKQTKNVKNIFKKSSFRLKRSGMEKSPANNFNGFKCRRFLDYTSFRSE